MAACWFCSDESKLRCIYLFVPSVGDRTPAGDQLWVSSVLVISLKELQDFGTYSCTIRNASADFCIHTSGGSPQFCLFFLLVCVLTTRVNPAHSHVLTLKIKKLLASHFLPRNPQSKQWNLSSPVVLSLDSQSHHLNLRHYHIFTNVVV